MRVIAPLIGFTLLLTMLFTPATVFAAVTPEQEEATVDLIGLDAKGDFTIFLEKTQTGTSDIAFVMGVAIQTNFDGISCRSVFQFRDDTDEVEFCERDLWVAVLLPDSRLFFLQLLNGPSLAIQDAGSLNTLPDLPGVQPYLRLGGSTHRFAVAKTPTPPAMNLFFISQTAVNALPAGKYSIFAGFTTRVARGDDLFDLFANAVSNVAQYDVIIEEFTVPCGQVQVAGGDTPDTRLIDLGNIGGTFRFDFQTFSQKDRMIVSYEGRTLFDTGCVGTSGSALLSYSGSSTKVSVQVILNCAGGLGTAWNYTVHCPTTGAFNLE